MMKVKVIALGAAGGKAAINLIQKEVVSESQVMIVNSTMSDVPAEYQHLALKLTEGAGCGKERTLSKNLVFNELSNNGPVAQKFASFLDPEDQIVIIVTSTAGGTGSGSAPIVAGLFEHTSQAKVHCFAFTGFEEDGRELQNTIEFFNDMEENYTIEAISNKKFLDDANGNAITAEKLANDEFANRIKILIGQGMIDSEQNMDDTDLFKVDTIEGYMTIVKADIEKIKNVDQFNKEVINALDNDKALESSEKSAKRIGVIINAPEKIRSFIDFKFEKIKERLGVPYELFRHVQYNEEMPIQIAIIASGMKMPTDEMKETYERYKTESESVNKTKDNFFSFMSELKGNKEDQIFDSAVNNKKPVMSKADYLDSLLRRKKPETKAEEEVVVDSIDKY